MNDNGQQETLLPVVRNGDSPVSGLEQTIASMEVSLNCIHPIHYHSFEPVSLLLSGPMRLCAGCDTRLPTVRGPGGPDQVVRCLACGSYAHRACTRNVETSWTHKCAVNSVVKIISSEGLNDDDSAVSRPLPIEIHSSMSSETEKQVTPSCEQPWSPVTSIGEHTEIFQEDRTNTLTSEFTLPSLNILNSVRNMLSWGASHVSETTADERKIEENEVSPKSFVWTDEGPPQHWASSSSIKSLTIEIEDEDLDVAGEESMDLTPSIETPFLAVARAVQENVLRHFQKHIPSKIDYQVQVHGDEVAEPLMASDDDSDGNSLDEGDVKQYVVRSLVKDEVISSSSVSVQLQLVANRNNDEEAKALLTEVAPAKATNSMMKLANDGYDAAVTSASLRKKLGYASIAGGIAGGVAGLFVAGPAGLVIGAKCGQTVGFLGVALEGTYSIGVLVVSVAGAAAAGFTVAQKLQNHHQKRVLTLGEKDSHRKLLLVRPNVWIDPEWDTITAKVKQSTPTTSNSFLGMLSGSAEKQAEVARQERSKRDADIVQTDEFEIPTDDKILLLVSRSLNCKHTVPGHVYRSLIDEHRKRSERRVSRTPIIQNAKPDGESLNGNFKQRSDAVCRGRREDAHAVIKHVTATLLEVRPGFAHSAKITEMSAAAVESLVFGELYNSVFDEIVQEMRSTDDALLAKFNAFELDNTVANISNDAIKALNEICEAHSVVEKLRFCVVFLERVADHFDGGNLSADSLLKMVCQHICVAKVPNLNAEIAFVEEFARDEQLLKGKEGYALVTLQASLHFLNASVDFENDIFHEDET